MAGPTAQELTDAQAAMVDYLMPDDCQAVTPGTQDAGHGQKRRTGVDTVTASFKCRRHQFSAQEIVAAQGARVDADYRIAAPVGTVVTEAQEIKCTQSGQRFRVTDVRSESMPLELVILCKEIKEGA